MKRVLCYGDSNTWGYDPHTGDRFDQDTRWTGVLGKTLGSGYEVIEEGLNGRTTVWDDPIEGYKSGKDYLIPCLESHQPLDLVVILLGTNDSNLPFGPSSDDVAEGVRVLVGIVQGSRAGVNRGSPQVILLAPPPTTTITAYAEVYPRGEETSFKFSANYARIAQEMGCAFFDTATVIVYSPLDGIHFEAREHRKLGQAVAMIVRELFEQPIP